MFKKFTKEENISSSTQVKTSVARGIKAKLVEQMPILEVLLPDLMPKKSPVYLVKCKDRLTLVVAQGRVLFFQERDGPFFPELHLLHEYPDLLPRQQVDVGAIRFVLSGAHIMCPGLTSPGAKLIPADAGQPVAIMAEGKEHALGVGIMKLSAEEIEKKNKGIGVDSAHYLNDGLWRLDISSLKLK